MMLLVSISVLIVFSSCNNNKEQIARLKVSNDSLLSLGFQKDTTVIAYVAAFNSIQANLDSIKGKEMIISKSTKGGGELKQDAKDQINQDIKSIYELLQKNRRIVAGLKSRLKKSNARIVELEKMIETLNAQIEAKDADIAVMKADLEKLNIKVAELNTSVENLSAANSSKAQTIDEQTKALNTAYYIIGTSKDLKARNVITKEGGFAGIGRNKKLKEDFNKELFTRIDITTFRGVALGKKAVSVITNHPKTAYSITGAKTKDSLVVKNPAEFWTSSKFLVIVAE